MKRIIVLGSTGSIGESTLAVARALPDFVRVVGLACAKRRDRLETQASEFHPDSVALADDSVPFRVPGNHRARVFQGGDAALRMIRETPADMVVNGICGAQGLLPSLASLRSGADLALANKESLVMAGSILLAEAQKAGRRVLPVDSEHAALFDLLNHRESSQVAEILLTASGGAVLDCPLEELQKVRFADALKHPTWKMGRKITIDSATMANKGLEVIEAHRLFGIPLSRIRVLIHPQSIVHSLLRTIDGTLFAALSTPDMRIPIQNALTYPSLMPSAVEWLDLAGKGLTFLPVDERKYRMLGLAYEAAAESPAHPIAYNAANEVAVAAFARERIPFTGIHALVEDELQALRGGDPSSVEDILRIDAEVRRSAEERINARSTAAGRNARSTAAEV